MSASYVVGANKVFNGTEPRFMVLSGDEYALKERLIDAVRNRSNIEWVRTDFSRNPQRAITSCFTQAQRTSRTKVLCLTQADNCRNWDWVPVWLNRVKGVRVIVPIADSVLAERVAGKANTRGINIDCSRPTTDSAQSKLIKLIGSWYGTSPTQLNLLLIKNDWNISACLELLDKLALLNLPLNSDTMERVGVVHEPYRQFIDTLVSGETALAMTLIPRLNTTDYGSVLTELSEWLDKLARIKGSVAYMKSARDIAFETGEQTKTVEKLLKLSRKYDLNRLNKISLALAAADREVFRGNTNAVMEVLVSKW